MELKPRYWMARLIIALEALMLIALPGLVDSGTLVYRLMDDPGGHMLLLALAFCTMVSIADVIVNDLMPVRFRLGFALNHRHWGLLVIAGLLSCISFVAGFRGGFNAIVLACWLNAVLSGAVTFLDFKHRYGKAARV